LTKGGIEGIISNIKKVVGLVDEIPEIIDDYLGDVLEELIKVIE
jgi:hypothetical protein